MTRRQLEAELESLREIAGLLKAALEAKHCPQDCSCRTRFVANVTQPLTTNTTAVSWVPPGEFYWVGGGSQNT